ncbi:MAG: SsrA-binding protein SmpB [Gammaproteobacteria bacterium]|nr:SsrA-binding protein SmpB [Gammaproteobacteria bacterium]
MNTKIKKKSDNSRSISVNKKAFHDYHIEQRFEAGLVLEGWEVKSIRAGRLQLRDSYVILKKGEAWLIGFHISPLQTVSTHITPDPLRTRKLLLHAKELRTLIGSVQRKGYTLTALSLYWKNNRVKLEIGLAKGKKDYDKRESLKQRDWDREKQRTAKISRLS